MRSRTLARFVALVLLTGFVVSSPPPLGAATTDTFRDEFNTISYSGDDGIGGSWAGGWFETDPTVDPSADDITVEADGAEVNALRFNNTLPGDYVERTADLSAYDSATLVFEYRRVNTDAAFSSKAWVSANGPAGPFTEVFSIASGDDATYVATNIIDITAHRSATTTVRLSHEAGLLDLGRDFYLDDVEIAASSGNLPPVADATNGEPYVINEGDPVTLDGSDSSDPEVAPLTYAWDLDNDSIFGEPGEPVGVAAIAATPLVTWATLQSFGIDDDGSYPIGLQVTDDTFQSDTTTTTLTVNNTAPTITATGAASVDKDAIYTLNLSAVDPGNETISGWMINWGDGTIAAVGDVSSATHVYSGSGFTRNITVSVTDEDGTFIPGDLLVTSLLTDSLFRFDATSGGFLEEFADLNGLGNPIDVEIGPDGLVYVSGFVSDDITRYDATTGAFVSLFIAPGSGGLNAPARMVFGPDGNLYISNYPTDEVLRFDGASGAFIDVFVSAGSGTLDQPDGITFGVDGNLYVVSGGSGEVLRYDGASGAFIDIFALIGPGGTGYADLAFGPDSNLYVSSVSLNKVQRFDGSTGVKINDFVAAGSGGIGGADGLAFGPDGYLYVVGFTSHNVLRYDATSGAFVNEFASASAGMVEPINLVFTPAEQVLVNSVNLDPLAVDDADTTAEDTAVTVDVLGNDTDGDFDPLVVDSVTQGGNGSVTDNDTDVTYTPNQDWNGTDTFTYTISDGSGGFDTATVTVTVSAEPDPPVAVDDADSTLEDSPVTVDVLGNDTDADLDPLVVDSVTQGGNGSVTDNDTDVTYTPDPGWNGVDTFTYTVSDGNGGFDTGTVTVTVSSTNVDPLAVDDADTTAEDTAVTVDVLGNDTDGDFDPLVVDSVTQGGNGSVTDNDTDVTYTPNQDWNGTDTFTYTISDGSGGFDTATVTVTVSAEPDPPVAVDDADSTLEDSPVTVDVLGNDTDADLDPLVVDSVTQGGNGSVTDNDTDVTYTPDPGWNGVDTFTYTVSDGNGGFDTGTVTVTVSSTNVDPLAVDDADTTAEDTAVTVDVLGNDTDGDFDPLVVDSVTQGGNGSVTDNDTDVTYTPNQDWNGTDTFTYTISDGQGGTDSATVTVTVAPFNDDPEGKPDVATTFEDTAVGVDVLANDSDVDSSALTITAVSNGTNGGVTTDGLTVTYTPDLNWFGTDTFTYRVSDDLGGWSETDVTVTVTPVNDDPVAVDDVAAVVQDTPVNIWVLDNDSDPDPDLLSVWAAVNGAHGTVVNHGIKVTYTPAPGWAGIDSFTYTVTDGNDRFDTASVTVTVTGTAPTNHPPVAQDDSVSTDEDTVVTIAALANDSDPDGDTVAVTAVNQGAHGSVTQTATGITYTPEKNWSGIDSFSYSITDGRGGTAAAAVVVTVKPVNDPPVARDDSKSTPAGTSVAIPVLANDSDVDGGPLAVATITQGSRGVTTTDGNTVTYSPSPGWFGTDAFTYSITDGRGGFADAAVTVTVTAANTTIDPATVVPAAPRNQPPVITVIGDPAAEKGTRLRLEVTAEDPDGDGVSISASGLPGWLSLVDYGGGRASLSGVPWSGADPSTEITISASDGIVTARVVVTIEVTDVTNFNRPPSIAPIVFSGVHSDGSFSFTISASDPNGDPLIISTAGLPPWAQLTDHGNGNGTIISSGVPNDAIGSFSAVVSVTDGLATVTSTVSRSIADLRNALPPELTHQAFGTDATNTLVATALKPRVGTPDPLGAHLTPREGLMVAFGSAVETMKNQILPALVLGVVMAWMLMIGVGRTKEEEEPETA